MPANDTDTSHQANALPEPTELRVGTRFAFWVGIILIVLTVGGVGLWSWLFPINQSITVSGVVQASTDTKPIEHLEGGIVDTVMVQEGDSVEAGDTLLVLDDTSIRSEKNALEIRIATLQIQQRMLKAQQSGAETFSVPSKAHNVAAAEMQALIDEQQSVLTTRLTNHRAQLDLFSQQERTANVRTEAAQQELEALNRQINLARKNTANLRRLREQGHVSQTQMDQEQMELLEREERAQSIKTRLTDLQEQLKTVEAERKAYKEEYQAQISQQLSQTGQQLRDLSARRERLANVLSRTTIRAPEDGVVVDMVAMTSGTVVQAGKPMMRILPKEDPLVLQVYIEPANIDKVYPNQKARLMFNSFDTKQAPIVTGTLTYISEDTVQVNEQVEQYQGEIIFDAQTLEERYRYRLRPGMRVDVFLDGGEITLLGYILKPLLEALNFVFVR